MSNVGFPDRDNVISKYRCKKDVMTGDCIACMDINVPTNYESRVYRCMHASNEFTKQ